MNDLMSLNFNDTIELAEFENYSNECLGNCDCAGYGSGDCINDCDCANDCN